MSKAPTMPMYWDAYLADTTHLNLEEHGAYMLLLGAMWRRDGSVPDDDKDNARILGITQAKWRKLKIRLSAFLTIENGQISQKNLKKIWENTQEKIEKNRANGAKGGRPKSNKNNDMAKANGSVSVNPNHNPNESNSDPEPDPEVKEERSYDLLSPDADAQSIDAVATAVSAYNAAATASGWPKVQTMNPKRRASLKARLRECGGIEGWEVALAKAQASDHCCGRNNRGWTASFDFLTQQTSFAKLMEGNYDNRTDSSQCQPDRQQNRADPALEQIARLAGIGAA